MTSGCPQGGEHHCHRQQETQALAKASLPPPQFSTEPFAFLRHQGAHHIKHSGHKHLPCVRTSHAALPFFRVRMRSRNSRGELRSKQDGQADGWGRVSCRAQIPLLKTLSPLPMAEPWVAGSLGPGLLVLSWRKGTWSELHIIRVCLEGLRRAAGPKLQPPLSPLSAHPATAWRQLLCAGTPPSTLHAPSHSMPPPTPFHEHPEAKLRAIPSHRTCLHVLACSLQHLKRCAVRQAFVFLFLQILCMYL